VSRIRRLSYAISDKGRRALPIEQAARIRESVLALLEQVNQNAQSSRRITKKSAFTVVLRSLQSTRNLPFSLREHMALKELSQYINLAQNNKTNSLTLSHTDLLPIAHPRSTRNHSLTASALREARIRWIVDDARITDDKARTILASALTAEVDSVEHTYFTAMLSALPQGTIPGEVLIAAIGDGNSPLARSLRAQLQRRDRKGRFAYMGGGIRALIRRGGKVFSLVGKTLMDAPDGKVLMELPDGRIAKVTPEKGEYVKAILNPTKDGYSEKPVRTSVTDEVIDESDLEFVEAPEGWVKEGGYTWKNGDWVVTKDDFGNFRASDGKGNGAEGNSWADILDQIDEIEKPSQEAVAELPAKKPEEAGKKEFEFNYPAGAFKLKVGQEYEPQGAGEDEDVPNDFTDDPVELAQKFDPRDLKQALEEAIIPQGENENAFGVGPLAFNDGDGLVEADAIYNALKEAGEDADLELARIYDKANNNDNNEKALLDFRKGPEVVRTSQPDVAEAFERVTEEGTPDVAPAAETPEFVEEKRDETPLPALLKGLTENELARFMESKDHTPHLPKNKDLNAPEGYNKLDPSPFNNWREVNAENPDPVLPEGFSDNPVFLAQNISEDDLKKELRRALEPGNEAPGYGAVKLQTEDGEDFVANVPGEAIRDALQLQGVDTDEEINKIYTEGRPAQKQGIDDDEAGRILAEIEKEEGPLDKPENKEALRRFNKQLVKEMLDEEENLADKFQDEEDMVRGDAQAAAEAEMKRKYGKTAIEALNGLSREDAMEVLDEREKDIKGEGLVSVPENRNIRPAAPEDFEVDGLQEIPNGLEEYPAAANVAPAPAPAGPGGPPPPGGGEGGGGPYRITVKVTDLKPGDITVGDNFVITEIGEKVPGTDRVKIKGYYPGHVEQDTKQWNEWREIEVIRGAEAPEKGDLPVLSKPKEKDFGRRKKNADGTWGFANPDDQARFDAAMAEYNIQLDAARKRWTDPTEPTNQPHRIVVAAADLKPGDVSTDPEKGHFVVERTFVDEKTKPGFVSVEGYYPGHVTQRKEWKVDTPIDVIRNVEAPAKGDLPELHQPHKIVNGKWIPDKDKEKRAEWQKKIDEAAARWQVPADLPVVAAKENKPEEDKDIPNAVAIKKPGAPRQVAMPAFQGRMAEIAREAGGDWAKFEQLLADETLIFFDFETTGINDADGNEPWQVAAIKVQGGKVVDRINVVMNPGRSIKDAWAGKLNDEGKPNAVDLDGNPLTDEYLEKQISQAEGMKQLFDWAGPDGLFVAYNMAFDDEVARRMADKHGLNYAPAGLMDILPMQKDMFKDEENKPAGNRLGDIAAFLDVNLENWHAADADAAALAEIFQKLVDLGKQKGLGKDLFDVDARNDEYIKKLDVYNERFAKYQEELANYHAAKALQDALAGKEVNADDVVKAATAKPQPENVNMGQVGNEAEPIVEKPEVVVLDFTPNVDFPRGKMILKDRDWALDDKNTVLLPRDNARMRDILPGDFMQSKDGKIVWQVVAVRGGEEFGLREGRIKIFRKNVEDGSISTYEHWHGTRLDGVRRPINPRDLDAPATVAPEEAAPVIANEKENVANIEEKSVAGDVVFRKSVDIGGFADGYIRIKKNKEGRYEVLVGIVDNNDEALLSFNADYRTYEAAVAEAEAVLKERTDELLAERRQGMPEPAEARAKDVPVSRGDLPANAENAPEIIEVENLPADVFGKVQIEDVGDDKPDYKADAVVHNVDGDLIANQSTRHTNKGAAEKEGRDFVNRVVDAIQNPEKPAETPKPKKPLSEKEQKALEEKEAIEKDNAWVEANAGLQEGVYPGELKAGEHFLWNAFFGQYEEILDITYIGFLNRYRITVQNRVTGEQETRYYEADTPIRNVRLLGAQDDEFERIEKKGGTNRGARRGLIKRKPLDERIVAKTGRPMAGRFDIEGYFKDKNGNPLAPGDVVMHPEHGRGVIKKREGAQVEEGKRAGGVVRAGKVLLDELMVQFENEEKDWVIRQGGRLAKAKKLIKLDQIDSPIVLPDFRGGRVVPKLRAPAKQEQLIEVKKEEQPAPAPAPEAPQRVYRGNVLDKKGKEFDISVVKIGNNYEAAVFPKEEGQNAEVIAKNENFGEVQAAINRFVEDVINSEDGNKVLRQYAGLPEPEVQPMLTRETAVVPELPVRRPLELKVAKANAKDLVARIQDKEFVPIEPFGKIDQTQIDRMNDSYKREIIRLLNPGKDVDRRQRERFSRDMRYAAKYARNLGWFEEARQLEALAGLQQELLIRPMDEEFKKKVADLEALFPEMYNIYMEGQQFGWRVSNERKNLQKNFNDVLMYPDLFNPNFRNGVLAAPRNVDDFIEQLRKIVPDVDGQKQIDAFIERLEKLKAGFQEFGELPKLPAPKVGSDEANQRMAKLARDFAGLSVDRIRNGVGDWRFERDMSAGINGLFLMKNKVSGEYVLIKIDRDKGNAVGKFLGNGIKAEEMVAMLYKDLGFAQPAVKAVNPDSNDPDIGGVGVMEFADAGFFNLVNIKKEAEARVRRIEDVMPEHQLEVLQFVIANAIVGNTDRHHGNFMWGIDPDTGKARIIPIDNGLALFNGSFGQAEKNSNDPLYLDPIKVLFTGQYGNRNGALKYAGGYVDNVGIDAAESEIVEFATRMRERAAALALIDARAAGYIGARAEFIIQNARRLAEKIRMGA